MSDDFNAWDSWFVDKPVFKQLSSSRVMLSGKCRWCFGNGRVYVRGDYEPCKSCNSITGFKTIILNTK